MLTTLWLLQLGNAGCQRWQCKTRMHVHYLSFGFPLSGLVQVGTWQQRLRDCVCTEYP